MSRDSTSSAMAQLESTVGDGARCSCISMHDDASSGYHSSGEKEDLRNIPPSAQTMLNQYIYETRPERLPVNERLQQHQCEGFGKTGLN